MDKEIEQWNGGDGSFFIKWAVIAIATCIVAVMVGLILSSDATDQADLVREIDVNTDTVMALAPSTERTEYLLFIKSILNDSTISVYEETKEDSMFESAIETDDAKKLKAAKAAISEKLSNELESEKVKNTLTK